MFTHNILFTFSFEHVNQSSNKEVKTTDTDDETSSLNGNIKTDANSESNTRAAPRSSDWSIDQANTAIL